MPPFLRLYKKNKSDVNTETNARLIKITPKKAATLSNKEKISAKADSFSIVSLCNNFHATDVAIANRKKYNVMGI